ncbi:MAG: hypothetical protein DMF56_15350 [Acidobacteria bacterium]|nr:MAG: hypothetical protein DMF56_15350 [Acidobacteriota bacterium]
MATDESDPAGGTPSDNPSQLQQAADAGDAAGALLAVSTSATADDAKKAVIFNCIVANFVQQGFPSISNQTSRIVWSTIGDTVIQFLGNGITNCISEKNYQCPALAPVFATLKEMNQVTVVSDLVTGIATLVTP